MVVHSSFVSFPLRLITLALVLGIGMFTAAQGATAPTVDNPTATGIGPATATLGATVEDKGAGTLREVGVAYGLKPNADTKGSVVTAPTNIGTFTVQVKGLKSNTNYYYRGYATNEADTGYAPEENFVTGAGVPTGLKTSNPTASGFDISWAPAADNGGTEMVTYTVQVNTDPTFVAPPAWTDSTTDTTDTATDLAPNTLYYVEVSGNNGEGSASAAAGADGSVTRITTADSPTGLITSKPTADGFTIAWSPASHEGGADAVTYTVKVNTDPTFVAPPAWTDSTKGMSDTASKLAPNTLYYIEVSGNNGEGSASAAAGADDTVTQVTGAGVPTNLRTSNPTASGFDMAWKPASRDGGVDTVTYTVQVNTDPTFVAPPTWTDSTTDTTDTVTGLAPNMRYYVEVSGNNGTWTAGFQPAGVPGTAEPPPVWSASVLQVTAADTPTGLGSSKPTAEGFAITWSLASHDGGADTVTYTVQVSTDAAFVAKSAWKDSTTGTSDTASGLAPNTLYYVEVSGNNGMGSASDADGADGSVTQVTAAGVPTDVKTSNPTASGFDIAWSPAANDGGASTVTYTVQVNKDSTFVAPPAWTDSTTGTTDTVNGLTCNTLYYVKVWADNGVGSASVAAGADASVKQVTTAGVPSKLVTANPTAHGFPIAWSRAADDGGAQQVTFSVQVNKDPAFAAPPAWKDTIKATKDEASGLASNTLYYVKVSANNGEGDALSEPAAGADDSVMQVTAAGVPTGLGTSNPTASGFDIAWSPAADDGGANTVTYTVEVNKDSTLGGKPTWTDSATVTTDTVNGLDPNTKYYIRVCAKNDAGDPSAYCASATQTTTADVPPEQPIK